MSTERGPPIGWVGHVQWGGMAHVGWDGVGHAGLGWGLKGWSGSMLSTRYQI